MGAKMRRNSPLWRALPMLLLWCTVTTVLSQQYPQQQQQQQQEDRCQDRSCYPITGNLLIGRKSQLSTTSTCGSQGRQRFCIVSHLEEQTKCFYCDSRTEWKPQREPYRLSHRIENVVSEVFEDKNRNWWQSENGQQNVTIQLDLEAEFHFTHLIMTFKSFRPAAMLIERSADFGKTWQIYRYFAYDCDQSFPGIAERTPVNHTDVICTSQYSDVAPSTGGEIVYKVISPHIETTNPYATEIANLLKITNLRFNFTKLHTLGDDLLDYRPEIDEKYYYAIYELVVRGSCSCYGHASRCIPIDPHSSPNTVMERPDIVHGRCECMHNTEGLNCEKCKAFFNDAPWRPAIGDEKNECRQCNCNRHAARCHFDTAVYMASGNVSGGVCDDCMHNTQGKHCEQCKPFFYRDPRRQIDDEAVCLPCQCHKAGSQNRGICEGEEDAERGLVAGKCYCKTNVDGQRCDRCKNGYWNLTEENVDGCVACTCNLLGTYNNEGCDKYSGMCTCKRLVTGENCDQCLPEHYGLSEHVDGCKACECDIGGSYDNTCDLQTGQCKCREGFTGRRCDTADSSFYCADITHYVYEAEYANVTRGDVKTREWPANAYEQTWTGEGFVEIGEGSIITVYPQVETTSKYNVILRHDAARDPIGWENVQLTVVRPDNEEGLCDVDPARDFVATRLFPGSRYHEIQPAICLEAGKQYELRIQFNEKRTNSHPQERAAARLLIDSVLLAPPTEELHIFQGDGRAQQYLQEYQRYQCRHLALSLANNQAEQRNEVCQRYVCPVAAALLNKTVECNCDATGSVSGICDIHGGQCECKPNVVGRRCDQCAIGTYGFGPSGCSKCDCDAVGSLGNDCDKQSGQCECREKGIYGRQCNQCQPGFWGFPECRTCQCNDHANICDQATGACIECRDLTTGHYCDRCQDGYYGDPRLGVGIACKPCPCPGGPTSGYQHADTCYLRNNAGNNTQDIVCNCKSGYEGERCGECSSNYWGSPKEVGGSCERCDCNGNIDMGVDGSCDTTTGECLKCLHNTIGAQCETCADGFFGDAKQRTCQRCICNQLGTNSTSPDFAICDKTTGQCPCHANVVGARCDACDKNHYNLASGDGCESCDCDPMGVIEVAGTASPGDSQIIAVPHLQCNEFDGRCTCKAGRGGRRCNECEDLYWGDPQQSNGCQKCQCNPTGSKTLQCHRSNGTCECHPGSGGALCDQCARGFTGTWPQCRPCGECFHQWDAIMQKLKAQVDTLITTANNIEDTGVSSAYDADFEKMEATLRDTKQALADANISKEDIVEMSEKIRLLKGQVGAAREKLGRVETRISNLTQSVDFAQKDLERLQKESDKVTALTIELEEKAQQIKEADVLGAFNITRESGATSLDAQRRTDAAISRLARAENDASQAATLLDNNKDDFDKQFSENEAALTDAERLLGELEATLPSLNEQVCGASTAPCDALCGGPGHCGFCGGQSCMEGAVSKASQARNFATEADNKLDEKQKEAEEVLSIVHNVLLSTSAAKSRAEKALAAAKSAAERANATRHSLDRIADDIATFLAAKRATPEQIRQLAEEALTKKISLTPSQITDLTGKIKEALAKINNIGDILDETRDNKTLASALESQASRVSQRAEDIKTTMDAVREALRVAEEAQEAASLAIAEAEEITNTARNDLEEAKNETLTTEEKAREANTSLAELESIMGTVKVDYLQISEQAKNALKTVDDALQAASAAEQQNEQINGDIARANELLEKRSEGHEAPQKRAEKLRERAAKLLYQSQRHSSDIENLSRDATETRLDDYEQILADLNARLERVTADIHEKTDFHSTCG